MSELTIHLQPHHVPVGPQTRRWPRRVALSTLSVSSVLVALSTLAYRSFVHLPM